MLSETCPKCQSQKTVKNGSTAGVCRRKCKECGFQYTKNTLHGAALTDKLSGVLLYTHGLSLRAIGKLLGYSTPAVLYWIKQFAMQHCPKPAPEEAIIVELDEMWHFIQKKLKNSGSGKLSAVPPVALLIGNVAIVMRQPYRNSMIA